MAEKKKTGEWMVSVEAARKGQDRQNHSTNVALLKQTVMTQLLQFK